MNVRWTGSLVLYGCLGVSALRAQDNEWRPIIARTGPGGVSSRLPAVSLGAPQALGSGRPASGITQVSAYTMEARAQAPDPPAPGFGGPPDVPPPSYGLPPGVPPPPPTTYGTPVPVDEPFNPGLPPPDQPAAGGTFWGKCKGWLSGGPEPSCGARSLFQSDHGYDSLISPVTSPFLFEDPRALTEVRPLFFYQTAPSKNWVFRGGSAEFYGLQARLAVTERLSFVINKLGFVSLQPNTMGNGEFHSSDGFAEFWLGPKYTFFRGERSVAAAGATFQLPTGPGRVFQNTGNLSISPYVSYATSFGRSSFGNFDFMTTGGYSFATDDKRSEYLYSSFHLDYDIAHRVYPFVELNWRHYTQAGQARDLGFEGGDLINFGSRGVSGTNNLTFAVGSRYKFSEAVQLGAAAEWPVVGRKDIQDFRLTVDMIFRY